jgi:DNA-binding LacI/PurR family transcriptional regulator
MKTIGVLTVDVRDLYFSQVTYTIERKFTELGYNVLLSNTGGELGEKEKYLRIMLENQVDGLILVGSVFKEQTGNKHILAASEKVPVVMVNSLLEGDNVYSIVCDDVQGVREAVRYLIKNGRQEICYFNDRKSFSALAKVQGFKEEMAIQGLDGDNVVEILRSLEGGRTGVKKIMAEDRLTTAIITGEDLTAIGALKGLNELGYQVPGDVAVIGYNNSILAEVSTPTLTSIDNMAEAMANSAVQVLYHVLQGEQVSKKVMLSPAIIVRESTVGV